MTDAAQIAAGLSAEEREMVLYVNSGKMGVPVRLIEAGANRAILNLGLTIWKIDSDGDYDDIGTLTPLGEAVAAMLTPPPAPAQLPPAGSKP